MTWMTIDRAAQRAGVSASVIRQARVDGRFPTARRGPAVGRREAPWLISTEDLDAAGFAAAPGSGAAGGRDRPYLEQQVGLLRQSLEVLLEHVESRSEDIRIVALDVSAVRALVTAHLGIEPSIPSAGTTERTAPVWIQVARRLRNLLRTGRT